MVSVVLTTFERAAILPRAVESVLRQSHSDWELIIVDDGSSDGTSQYLDGLADSRIAVYRHPENRGVAAAKNTGLDHLSGEWFTFLDSDDEMTPDALSTLMDCATRTGATVITCNCVDFETGKMTGVGRERDGRLTIEEGARFRGEHWGMVRTCLLGDLRFDQRLPGFEGVLWLKVNRVARRYYLHRALRIYHAEGTDRVTVTARQVDLREKARVFCALGEDRVYLRALKLIDFREYRRTMLRVWAARFLRRVVFGSGQEPA